MNANPLETAIASTRSVLAGVSADQLHATTPCAQWDVSALINHIVGGQRFFATAIRGQQPSGEEHDDATGDYRTAFDAAAAECVVAFGEDGAMERTVTLPFGDMPGSAWFGLATIDTFTHGWDLAKATGQDTDLAPELATQLLAQARRSISPQFRSEDGAVFGLEQTAPDGASPADQLAAFLGRTV